MSTSKKELEKAIWDKRHRLLRFINLHKGKMMRCLSLKADMSVREFRFEHLGTANHNAIGRGQVCVMDHNRPDGEGDPQVRFMNLDRAIFIECGDDRIDF